jgi:carboxymethylenebutenolidase
MTPAVWITPRRDGLATVLGTVDIAQVDLGGIPRGAVLVMSADGAFEHEAAPILNDLAVHGYESVAADMTATEGTDDALMQVVAELLQHVGKRGWQSEQIGVIGYGRGGRLALLACSHFGLGAAVSISPRHLFTSDDHLSPEITELASTVRTPWLGMYGENDPAVPDTAYAELDRALRLDSPAYTQLVRYPGVGGDFYRKSSESHEIAASYDYWQRTIEWLNLRVAPRLTPLAQAWRHRQAAS